MVPNTQVTPRGRMRVAGVGFSALPESSSGRFPFTIVPRTDPSVGAFRRLSSAFTTSQSSGGELTRTIILEAQTEPERAAWLAALENVVQQLRGAS